ncbi:DUF2871 domain-containing protein [Paenibacillus aquistagni]|uniref:DUF2871 domain-containing protein n=1 Tax=Paenibacillus aquistagni TaxID=1852522 RepID=A0A1X7IWA9_9BACL|nr:DUF2871 domain-containing protein [Paenibacillus aquistagni]NMM50982.1 DUF2871 domain-containing protein [Paenibacillus aquistagni]SMG19212.1 Protein of unknown function [Paenibacillus aquistagni]
MKRLYYTSFFYAILGLISGIFYREYTKLNDFTGDTILKGLHTHILVLGFLFFLVAMILDKLFQIHQSKTFNAWYIIYNVGLIISLAAMTMRGLLQVQGEDLSFLPHIAGLGHAILGAGIIWLLALLRKHVK